MMQSAPTIGRRRILVAALVAILMIVGSAVVTVVTRNGGLRAVPAYAEGTILALPGGSASNISVVGDNLEVVVSTSPTVTSASIVLGSQGFRQDFRAKTGTYGLYFDSVPGVQVGVRRLTVVVPENGTLMLTLVGEARLVLDQARLKELRLAGASSALELDATESGSIIDLVQIENVTGGFSTIRLGNLDMADLVIGNIVGRYDLDFSGSLDRHCDVSLHTAVGNGTLRIPGKPGAQLSIGSVLGKVLSSGFVAEGSKSFLNASAASGADRRLVVHIDNAIGQIQLVEVQQ
ncbi:hypothetical protein [Candidatus Cryosericum odellii]|jgi:hypothetical protein|uniref:Adhesin domain-containing protein n=1 Tax=Candidatus Cryosericum odellii TaxID=2290917 RepID=A0A398D5E3_9BACT|nr:hypothetical protein [Candidatus Cryosericum odellii]RIE07658.1 hypothetical protein SMC6_05905 [Candidatus Cryosericum odellii]